MARILALRFDVDTELCLREGLPRLLELGDELCAYFTFFINPGRAIQRRDLFRTRRKKWKRSGPKLPVLTKLGWPELVRILALNPPVLPRHSEVLRRTETLGHELGLHGGRNHGAWARDAQDWSEGRLASEIDFGLSRLQEAGVKKPLIFASPGWNSPPGLPGILRARGFRALADSHGEDETFGGSIDDIACLHTALSGEPGGVGYLEFMRAQGATDEVILEDFVQRLGRETDFACVYDHPFYAGRKEINLIRKMIRIGREQGWRVEPMGSALPAKRRQ